MSKNLTEICLVVKLLREKGKNLIKIKEHLNVANENVSLSYLTKNGHLERKFIEDIFPLKTKTKIM
jgi:transcriptional regulator